MIKKMYPKCHPYWVDGKNKKIKNAEVKPIAYVSTGHLLPCCWCDLEKADDVTQYAEYGLFNEDLKVENNESTLDILMSPEWKSFHKMLLEEPEKAPRACKKHCSFIQTNQDESNYFE